MLHSTRSSGHFLRRFEESHGDLEMALDLATASGLAPDPGDPQRAPAMAARPCGNGE